MANDIRIKRRASGNPGAPASMKNAELAFNEVDDTLYYGKGTGGAGGTATTAEAIAGKGAVVMLQGAQTVAGAKTFSASPSVPNPSAAGHAANKDYVDTALSGLSQSVTLTGDVSGSGTTGSPITLTLANVVTAGTGIKNTYDAKGRITGSAGLAASDIPNLAASKITDLATVVQAYRLDQFAAPTAAVSFNNQRITGLADPTGAQDAATKHYVDMNLQGLKPKTSTRVATTANITLSGTQTIDGVAVGVGDRVFVKNQTTTSQNGIYVVASGAWTRATDADVWDELVSAFAFVEEGTANADKMFLINVDRGGTLGTTAVTVGSFGAAADYTGSNGVSVSGGVVSLTGQALALHQLATSGIIVRTGTDTVAARTFATSGNGITVTNGNGVSGNPTYSLSASLSSVGGLTPAADRLAYYTGATTAALATLTAYGRSLLALADAAAGRTALALGTMATQNANAVAITGGTIDNIDLDGGTF